MSFHDDDEIKVEGEPAKKFKLFTSDINNDPHECVCETDNPVEIYTYKRNLGKRYIIYDVRKRISSYDFVKKYIKPGN